MKKYLNLLLVVAMINATTTTTNAEENFHLKVAAGVNKMNRIMDKDEATTNCLTMRCKSKPAAIYMIGLGYNVKDKLRTDLTLEYIANPSLKGQTEDDGIKYDGKHKGIIGALMLNAYYDMYNINMVGLFVGGGLGVSKIKEKLTGSATNEHGASASFSVSTKNKYNLAYQLTLGIQTPITTNIIAELSYSWRDYGKTGKIREQSAVSASSHYKGHNVLLGFRYNL